MNILLDSHALLWSLHSPERLTAEARAAVSHGGTDVFYSVASVWELEIKIAGGKLEAPLEWLASVEQMRFRELPIRAIDARDSARLPWHHRDPFDRILVAQARSLDLHIATRDPLIQRYDVKTFPV